MKRKVGTLLNTFDPTQFNAGVRAGAVLVLIAVLLDGAVIGLGILVAVVLGLGVLTEWYVTRSRRVARLSRDTDFVAGIDLGMIACFGTYCFLWLLGRRLWGHWPPLDEVAIQLESLLGGSVPTSTLETNPFAVIIAAFPRAGARLVPILLAWGISVYSVCGLTTVLAQAENPAELL